MIESGSVKLCKATDTTRLEADLAKKQQQLADLVAGQSDKTKEIQVQPAGQIETGHNPGPG